MLHPTRTPMGKFSTSWYSMIFGQEKERSNDLPCQETFSQVLSLFTKGTDLNRTLAKPLRKPHLLKTIFLSMGTIIQKHEKWIDKPKSRHRFQCFRGYGWEELLGYIKDNWEAINRLFFRPWDECKKRGGCRN